MQLDEQASEVNNKYSESLFVLLTRHMPATLAHGPRSRKRTCSCPFYLTVFLTNPVSTQSLCTLLYLRSKTRSRFAFKLHKIWHLRGLKRHSHPWYLHSACPFSSLLTREQSGVQKSLDRLGVEFSGLMKVLAQFVVIRL